jgi:hypothetical protein
MKNLILSIKSRIIRKYNFLIDKKALKDNLAFKNVHAGKRCFIICNGPSIKSQDLTKLSHEWTFVVNGFFMHEQYDIINPRFYAFFDSKLFLGDRESLDFLDNLNKKVHVDTVLILPLKAKHLIEEKKILPQNKKIYIHVKGYFDEKDSTSVQIHKAIPTPMSVSAACLMAAIYMGFDPIYLLGVEHDWLAIKSTVGAPHFYETNSWQLTRASVQTYEQNLWSTYLLFRNYRLLKRTTDSKIYNLTPNSYLDVFPFKEYEDVVNNPK